MNQLKWFRKRKIDFVLKKFTDKVLFDIVSNPHEKHLAKWFLTRSVMTFDEVYYRKNSIAKVNVPRRLTA